jgi:tRNA G37 N-methylase TrmD
LSGNHQEIEKWKHNQSVEVTKKLRPDLLKWIPHVLILVIKVKWLRF